MPHTEMTSKSDFESAINTTGKSVLIYAYSGEVPAKATEMADKNTATNASFKVDVDKVEDAKQFFNVSTTPTVIIYKDGKEVGRAEGGDEAKVGEIYRSMHS